MAVTYLMRPKPNVPLPGKLDIQTSDYGLPITLDYGTRKIAGNCILYGNFQSHGQQASGGKGGGGGIVGYTYSVTLVFGLCMTSAAGRASVLKAWVGKDILDPAKYLVYDGGQTTVDPTIQAVLTAQGWTRFPVWKDLCYVVLADYDLGNSTFIPQFQWEVQHCVSGESQDLFVIGGIDPNNNSTNVNQMYDLYNDTWVKKAPMPVSWKDGAAVGFQGKIYCFGGRNSGGTAQSITYVYDISSDAWTTLSSMPHADYGMAAVADRSNIYIIGGHNNPAALYKYIVAEDRWVSLSGIVGDVIDFFFNIISDIIALFAEKANYVANAGTYDHTAQVYQNKIYCFGGGILDYIVALFGAGWHNITVYDIATDKWSLLQAAGAPMVHFGLRSVIHNDNIYCFGYVDDEGSDLGAGTAFKYNITTNTVTNLAAMPEPVSFQAIALAGDNIIIAGGESGGVEGIPVPPPVTRHVYSYSIPNNTFTYKADMLAPDPSQPLVKGQAECYAAVGQSGCLDVTPTSVIKDLLQNNFYGLGLDDSYFNLGDAASTDAYCVANDFLISPIFNSRGKAIDMIQYCMAHHGGYLTIINGKISLKQGQAADLVQVAGNTLTVNDMISQLNTLQLQVDRNGSKSYYNKVLITYTKRAGDYATGTTIADDLVDIDKFGLKDITVTLDAFTTYQRASRLGWLLLKRYLYNPRIVSFKLGINRRTLNPGDILYINDADTDLVNIPVRIKSFTEENYVLTVSAEEDNSLFYDYNDIGADTAVQGTVLDLNVDSGNVIDALIVEVPARYADITNTYMVLFSKSRSPAWVGTWLYKAYSAGGTYNAIDTSVKKGITGLVQAVGFVSQVDAETGATRQFAYIDVLLMTGDALPSALNFNTLMTTPYLNLVYIQTVAVGDIIILYTTATLVDVDTYRLTGLVYDTVGYPTLNVTKDIAVNDLVAITPYIPYTERLLPVDKGSTLFFKIPSYNHSNVIQALTVPYYSKLMRGLRDIPLTPHSVIINGVSFNENSSGTLGSGNLIISWQSRNRFNAGGNDYSRADAVTEDFDFVTFILEFWSSGILRRTVAQTVKSYTYTSANQSGDGIASPYTIKLRQQAMNGLSSDYSITLTLV